VEGVDGRPEEIVEVGFEARVLQGRDQGIEDVCDSACDLIAVWQETLIRLVGEGAEAVELEFVEDVIGG